MLAEPPFRALPCAHTVRVSNVEILFTGGCPHIRQTVVLVERVISELRVDADLRYVEVPDAADAVDLRFLGSPTVRVDGGDVEPGADERRDYSFGCRVYNGHGGAPDETWIRAALLPVG